MKDDIAPGAQVPFEFVGLARSYFTKCKAAHLAHNATINDFIRILEKRVRRYPQRNIAASMLQDIVARWKRANDPYRLYFLPNYRNTKGIICEVRIGFENLIHSAWEGKEANLAILFLCLSVQRDSIRLTTRVEHLFSFHAIARWYERSGKKHDDDLKLALMSALDIAPGDHELGAEVDLEGSWRGNIRFQEVNGDRVRLWCARTFLPE